MLDANLISFVEPIGPGQIVDRESLVALPVGYLQISIENNSDQVVVKILAARGIELPESEKNDLSLFCIKSYIWQNGQVLAGEDLVEGQSATMDLKNRRASRIGTLKKRRPGSCSFRFRKEQSENGKQNDPTVDAIMQVCVYKATSGTVKRKAFLGTVHIALRYLTCNQPRNSIECLSGKDGWFKIFPKSAFLPGSPSDIAKTNCYISGQAEAESQAFESEDIFTDDDDNETYSYCSVGSVPDSAISFSQYDLNRVRKTKSCTYPRSLAQEKGKTANAAEKRRQQQRRRKQQQQKQTQQNSPSVPVRAVATLKRSITMFFTRARSIDDVKATGRCKRPNSISTSEQLSSPPTPPVLVGFSPNFMRCDSQSSNYTRQSKPCLSHTYSSSNDSSVDVGYESSRSRCTSSDDDALRAERSRLSSYRKDINKKEIVEVDVIDIDKMDSTPIKIPTSGTSSLARPVTFNKPTRSIRHTSSPLRRSTRIYNSPGFTSLSEIGKTVTEVPKQSPVPCRQ